MSSHFPTSASPIARIRADGPPSVRERRIAGDTERERSSSSRAVNGQHLAVLNFVKDSLPTLFKNTSVQISLRVVEEDSVVEQRDDGVERLYQDCVLEVVANGLAQSELQGLRKAARSIVQQLSANPQVQGIPAESGVAEDFVRARLSAAFSPETDSVDASLLVLLGRTITRPFNLRVPELDDLPMSGKFISSPEYAGPATEQIFKGRIGSGDFLSKRKELRFHVEAPAGAKKKQEVVPIEYNPPQYRTLVYPLLEELGQVVYLRVKSSTVRWANGTTSSAYGLVGVLTAAEADAFARCGSDRDCTRVLEGSCPGSSLSVTTATFAV